MINKFLNCALIGFGILLGIISALVHIEADDSIKQKNTFEWSAIFDKTVTKNPYIIAKNTLQNQLILRDKQELTLVAKYDDQGQLLNGSNCYELQLPQFNCYFWTLYSKHKLNNENVNSAIANKPFSVNSLYLLANNITENSKIILSSAKNPQSYNWLATPNDSYQLYLNLHNITYIKGQNKKPNINLPHKIACPI